MSVRSLVGLRASSHQLVGEEAHAPACNARNRGYISVASQSTIAHVSLSVFTLRHVLNSVHKGAKVERPVHYLGEIVVNEWGLERGWIQDE